MELGYNTPQKCFLNTVFKNQDLDGKRRNQTFTLWFKNSLKTFFKAHLRTDPGQVCKFFGVDLDPEPLKLTSFHGQIGQWSQSWDIPKYVKSQTSQMNHSVEVSFQKLGLLGGEVLMQSNSKASMKKLGIRREYNLDQSPSWVSWHKISM